MIHFIHGVLVFIAMLYLTIAGRWASSQPPSLYIFINCSTRELAPIEKYVVWSPLC